MGPPTAHEEHAELTWGLGCSLGRLPPAGGQFRGPAGVSWDAKQGGRVGLCKVSLGHWGSF